MTSIMLRYGAGRATPEVGKAPSSHESARGLGEQGQTNKLEVPRAPFVAQALRVIEGEGMAAAYLARLQSQQADRDELALIVSVLHGATLCGFARVIEKALRGAA